MNNEELARHERRNPHECDPYDGPVSYKPVVQTDASGTWYSNALRFATREEALQSAESLMQRWMLVTDCDAHESHDPVNYRIDEHGELIAL